MADKEYQTEGAMEMAASIKPMSEGYYLVTAEDVLVPGDKSLADYINEGGGGGGSSGLVLYTLHTDLTWNSTLNELLTTLRNNGISKDDLCVVTSSSVGFPDVIVRIDDADPETQKARIPAWFSLATPLNMVSFEPLQLSLTIGNIQTFYYGGLRTDSKTIQGAINELSDKTIDKMDGINTYTSEKPVYIGKDSQGIIWTDTYMVGTGYTGEISLRAPLVEGDNISFEVDNENKVLKINASGGNGLPSYTEADEGKFLRLDGGEPKWVAIPNAEEAKF